MKTYPVHSDIAAQAQITESQYHELYSYSIKNPQEFWAQKAREFLSWQRDFSVVSESDFNQARIKWFADGELNVCYNCVDRHLDSRGEKTAIIWEANDASDSKSYTYKELYQEVNRMALLFRKLGVGKGDRVIIYLPMIPELAFAMLACARIGAIHSVVFAGFSSEALSDRIRDCSAKLVITANQGLRGSKTIELKEIVDKALVNAPSVEHVLVHQRTNSNCPMAAGRDLVLNLELEKVSGDLEPAIVGAEDPLFILYTSGSTGKPKGVLHTSAGYLLYAAVTHKYVFDYREDDIYFCAADIGWITGHSYIVYGPLANGATTVMFESVPNYPDPGRYWEVIDRHKVNIFYTAPTAIRSLEKEGAEWPAKYDLSSLRVLGSVGEPINLDAWNWYYQNVGRNRCALVDTWWQTETGGILITPLPGATPLKPGSATSPFFGIVPTLIDDDGKEIVEQAGKGRLCIKHSWPGQMRTVYGDHERFKATYFSEVPGMYFTGDAAERDQDGYYWIRGRVDDVLNVSGHRLGTAEIESALAQSPMVVESAVVGFPHPVKGTGIYAFCIAEGEISDLAEAEKAVKNTVREVIGPFAAPDIVHFVSGLPKTRSGKIMRRILRKIAEGDLDSLGDTSTLADPGVVTEIAASRKNLS